MPPKLILAGLAVLGLAMVGLAQLTGGDGGGDLALGETAVVGYKPTSGSATTLAVTVTGVRRGTQEQLSRGGFEVGADERGATPYYVDARFENRGRTPLERTMAVILEDSDGESLPRTLIFAFGDERFEPCPDISEGTLAPGRSYEACTLVLVPEGRDVDKVLFVSREPDDGIVFTRWDAAS